jgi:serine/threonine protein kinase
MHMSRRCHRDIKPENILLSGKGVPKVCAHRTLCSGDYDGVRAKLADFGISVQMGKGARSSARFCVDRKRVLFARRSADGDVDWHADLSRAGCVLVCEISSYSFTRAQRY